MPNLTQLADALTKIVSSPEPAAVDPPPEPEQPDLPTPEEEVAPVPELDELTRRSREYCKRVMPHLIYADELTPKQYQQKVREIRKAMRPPKVSWMDRFGRR
jgi:hypothetical protein